MRFKKDEKAKGLARVTQGERGYDIIDKIKCGRISDGKIRLIVNKNESDKIDENDRCDWKWIVLKKCFENNDEAKQWTKENWKELKEKFPIMTSSPI